MFRTVTFLTLVSHLQLAITTFHACVPNTQFYLNGLTCSCDAAGRWTEASCVAVARRYSCQPGKILWQGCSRCVCKENGQFLCNVLNCSDSYTVNGLASIGPRCTPFKIYYVNCSICVCPATGFTNNVHCARDTRCPMTAPSSNTLLLSFNKNLCLPRVIYIFPCLQCTCSDEGSFVSNNCVDTCHSNVKINALSRCTPKTFYKKNCNVCFCPDNMTLDDSLCTREVCNGTNSYKELSTLRSEPVNCAANQFTAPRCWYCDCNTDGTINKHACLELYCLKFNYADVSETQGTCNAGQMVAICTECFCFRNGTTHNDYCTKGCSYNRKLDILKKVLNDSYNEQLLDKDALEKNTINQSCRPNTIYIDGDKYCICPENGITRDFCLEATKNNKNTNNNFNFEDPACEITFKEIKVFIDYNTTCQPSTFVQFDCNTCFCTKHGTIDPKWCTYDDCAEKLAVHARQEAGLMARADPSGENCVPGTVYNDGCNFCICPEKGRDGDKTCTNNRCSGEEKGVLTEAFDCEPLSYYEVDCNTCYCPRDGKKNVDKCTKDLCERSFLRSDACAPGQLFSEECNVCVCPPNGNKAEKACTKHTCHSSAIAWKSIYKFSHNIIGNELSEDNSRKLDLCFPGEEFTIGCHLCVCPEMGIRSYATCSDMLCDEKNVMKKDEEVELTTLVNQTFELLNISARRQMFGNDGCFIYNVSTDPERQECTPGSMYIIRCRQCICPYFGNINHFCREQDPDVYCEQAYPNINFLPMGRRAGNLTGVQKSRKSASHFHTNYKCDQPGRVMDKCFVCECENKTIIREHCFRNDIPECKEVEPSFLINTKSPGP